MHDNFDQLFAELDLKSDRFIQVIAVRVALRASLLPLPNDWHSSPSRRMEREAWYFSLWLLLVRWIECEFRSDRDLEFSKRRSRLRNLYEQRPWLFEPVLYPDGPNLFPYERIPWLIGGSFGRQPEGREYDLRTIRHMMRDNFIIALREVAHDLSLTSRALELIRSPLYSSAEARARSMQAIEELSDLFAMVDDAPTRDWYQSLISGPGSLEAARDAKSRIEEHFGWFLLPPRPIRERRGSAPPGRGSDDILLPRRSYRDQS
jgi:hypothetical protein